MAPGVASVGRIQGLSAQTVCADSSSIISLERKPFRGAIPAMERPATVAMVAVIGISAASPPRGRASRVPVSWSTMPAVLNSAHLTVAWFRIWKTQEKAAEGVPKENRMVKRTGQTGRVRGGEGG